MTKYAKGQDYQANWLAEHSLPHPCEWCGEPVTRLSGRDALAGVIHHVDEDRKNNVIENLRCGHRRCHITYHRANESEQVRANRKQPGRTLTPAHRAALSRARKGRKLTAEHRAAVSAAKMGVPQPRISEIQRGRKRPATMCDVCGKRVAVSHLRPHQRRQHGAR